MLVLCFLETILANIGLLVAGAFHDIENLMIENIAPCAHPMGESLGKTNSKIVAKWIPKPEVIWQE
jgi:hypothetical protein